MAESDLTTGWTQVRAVLRVLFTTLAVLAGLWLVYALAGVIALVVLAIFFAYMLSPAVALVERATLLHRRPGGRVAAILLVYLLLFGSTAIAITALAPRFGAQLGELGSRAPGYVEAARARVQSMTRTYRAYRLPPGIQDAVESGASSTMDMIRDNTRAAVVTVVDWLKFLPWLILIPVLAFFFLKDAATFQQFAIHLFPEGRLRWRGRDFIDEINRTLALYVRAQLVACVFVGVVCGIGFAVLRVPYALVLGVLAGFLELIPLVGPLIIAVLAAFLASTQSITLMGVVLLFLASLRFAQDYVVYPRLVASGTKLHPLVIILTLVCGGHLAGVAGLFLAIPAAAVLMVAYRYVLLQLGQENLLAALVPPQPRPEPAPLRIGRPARYVVETPDASDLAGIRVAVVDNDEDTRSALVDLLEQSGATVYPAGSAIEALTVVEQNQPDVLLSDLAMPEKDGFDLIRSVRALPPDKGGAIRAAALSGYSTNEDRSRSLAAGFQEHLSKPVDPGELISTVRSLARPDAPLVSGGQPAPVPC